jgi:hypothetical protein
MKIANGWMILIFPLVLGGCSSFKEIEVRKAGDKDLSCAQLETEYLEAVKLERSSGVEKNVTKPLSVLVAPILKASSTNAERVETAASLRKQYLELLMMRRNCGAQAGQ